MTAWEWAILIFAFGCKKSWGRALTLQTPMGVQRRNETYDLPRLPVLPRLRLSNLPLREGELGPFTSNG
jgi:hypothetical protein